MNYVVVDVKVKVQYTRRKMKFARNYARSWVKSLILSGVHFQKTKWTLPFYRQGRKEISKKNHQDDGRFPLGSVIAHEKLRQRPPPVCFQWRTPRNFQISGCMHGFGNGCRNWAAPRGTENGAVRKRHIHPEEAGPNSPHLWQIHASRYSNRGARCWAVYYLEYINFTLGQSHVI